ncbi:hypothetical protein SEA_ANON_33 [Gordonia phage Anon]|nr:hypothetical protein SEA_ANON_33 [Gordonia phage Anon]
MKIDEQKVAYVHEEHRMCRVFQHAWEYTTVKQDGRNYLQGLRCIRCGTEREMKVNSRTGEAGGSRYKYADGYLMKGIGALTQSERAALRLAEVSGHAPAARKRRRKK